jgi:hypothetical protein
LIPLPPPFNLQGTCGSFDVGCDSCGLVTPFALLDEKICSASFGPVTGPDDSTKRRILSLGKSFDLSSSKGKVSARKAFGEHPTHPLVATAMPFGSHSTLLFPDAGALCAPDNILGDWSRFRRELQATEKGYKDTVRLLEKIVGLMPFGVKLQLSNVPFFQFREVEAEQGYLEVIALRKTKYHAFKANACLYAFVAALSVYAFSTCDIDKNMYRDKWVATAFVCGSSFIFALAAMLGMKWSLDSISEQMHQHNVLVDNMLYSTSRRARTLSKVSDD